MAWTIWETIYDAAQKRRVVLFRRDDGTFGFQEERFSSDPLEQCWLPFVERRSECRCDSLESAMREARGRIDWLVP